MNELTGKACPLLPNSRDCAKEICVFYEVVKLSLGMVEEKCAFISIKESLDSIIDNTQDIVSKKKI